MTKDGQGQGAAASSNRGASPNLVWGEQNAEELPKNCRRTAKNCSLTKMDANHNIIVYPNRERCD